MLPREQGWAANGKGFGQAVTAPPAAARLGGGFASSSRRNDTLLLQTFACFVPVAVLLVFRDSLMDASLRFLSNVGSICVILSLALTYRVVANGVWSPALIYLGVLAVFHFGLTSVLGIGLLSDPMIERDQISYWLFRDSTRLASYLASIGVVSCGLGVHLGLLWNRLATPGIAEDRTGAQDEVLRDSLSLVGCSLVALSVAAWFTAAIASGGPGILIQSYAKYLEATENYSSVFGYIWFCMGNGLCFQFASGVSRRNTFALVPFAVFALFAFPIGLRGEILFSALPAVVIYACRRKPPSARVTIVVGLLLLVAISLVKNLRQFGLGNASLGEVEANPLDALVEMGASLRPVSEVADWIATGDAFLGGASYWAPIDRMLFYVIPGWTRPLAEADPRLLNVVIQRRVGPIGFSPIAEAYYNFGDYGVAFVMLLTGLLLGKLDGYRTSSMKMAVVGMVLIELLINVRNNFITVPTHVSVGLMTLAGVFATARFRRPKTRGGV